MYFFGIIFYENVEIQKLQYILIFCIAIQNDSLAENFNRTKNNQQFSYFYLSSCTMIATGGHRKSVSYILLRTKLKIKFFKSRLKTARLPLKYYNDITS